jgi:iduronate 2-sulfatase
MTARVVAALIGFVLLPCIGYAQPPGQAPPARPNVLLIMSDDLNDDMMTFGHPVVKTPHLERLASRGVRFERAYTQFALCNPSRASYMTGLRPDTIRVYDLGTHFREAVPDVVTLPQMFTRAGYYAARVGKIYHYGVPSQIGTSGLDDPESWDHAINPQGVDVDEGAKVAFAGPSRALGSSLSYYASPEPDEAHTDGLVATETIALIEQNRDRPFFIAAGFYRPHCPFIAPQKYFDLYPDLSRMPVMEFSEMLLRQSPTASRGIVWNVPEDEQREALRAYYASITFMDAQVGRLLDALDHLGLADNTIVVFMSDHGYHLGDHGGLWMKQSLFERSLRTPLLVAGPGVSARGQASRRIVELLDLYPTLADLTGVAPPAGLEGRSLRPLLHDPHAEWNYAAFSQTRRALASLDGRGGRGGRAGGAGPAAAGDGPAVGYSVRTERWRYIEWDGGRVGQELYDAINDPGEIRNLADVPFYTPVIAEMRQLLAPITAGRRE